ncbi:MBL fold metallo-hydrolase [Halapricum desulfuricans]|uniref:Metal-dependent hydrolase of the beta-lactamase superfamily II n=1 Tax=Halapricum desulfuricans TaxID=2841257 RepID=A0A897N9U1_9EURY|nr:MBL fold metallo-hydrolase [Halapricum desulfuricans]QSG09234.1 Metal-dependent hydrolase of the beta-lactamase superfamily II [Halapricum desulfuricans]
MEIAPGIWTRAIEWSYGDYEEPLSVHVARPAETTVMIGGGDESIAPAVIAFAREHDVEAVVVEHAHVDHYGAVPRLRAELDVTVAAPTRDRSALSRAGIDVDVSLRDGERQWGIEPIATPGHTPGNMAYRADDVLFAGDTVVGSDSAFAADDDWSGPLAVIDARFNDADTRTRESVRRLDGLSIETLLVSHGSHVHHDASEAIETLLADLDQ